MSKYGGFMEGSDPTTFDARGGEAARDRRPKDQEKVVRDIEAYEGAEIRLTSTKAEK